MIIEKKSLKSNHQVSVDMIFIFLIILSLIFYGGLTMKLRTIYLLTIILLFVSCGSGIEDEENRNTPEDGSETVSDKEDEELLPDAVVNDEETAVPDNDSGKTPEDEQDKESEKETEEKPDGNGEDLCPDDPDKTEPGICGCNIPDVDSDSDGIMDCKDKCPLIPGDSQEDSDGDGFGNECDNCPYHPNKNQDPSVCDPALIDPDGDGVETTYDNCPGKPNPDQLDTDKDGIGDECDNCPLVPNFDQLDENNNGKGDVCEEEIYNPDLDGDGFPNTEDNCPNKPNDQTDSDGDGIGDACDNCPNTPNANQVDYNNNGIGDACDTFAIVTEVCEDVSISGTRLKPNVYFMLDASGSMTNKADCDEYNSIGSISWCKLGKEVSRWKALVRALKSKASTLSSKFNIGAGSFPGICDYGYNSGYCGEEGDEEYNFKQYIPLTISYSNEFSELPSYPNGGTPLPEALTYVKEQKFYNLSSDEHSAARTKAVVVITDADDADFNLNSAIQATTALADDGIKVFYMGFEDVNTNNMQQLANAGGNSAWYPITDTNSIIAALDAISSSIVSCVASVELAEGTDPTRISVEINNNGSLEPVEKDPVNGWSFDTTEKTVTLNGTSCNKLKSYQKPDTTVGISIKIACEVKCEETNGGVEICDYIDNDCNGKIDDGLNCGTGLYEICGDNQDNDGDGEIDEGCPDPGTCIPETEKCGDNIDNNCNGIVDEGCDQNI